MPPGKQGRAQRLIPGISSWETAVWAEESAEHRAGRPLGSLVMLRTGGEEAVGRREERGTGSECSRPGILLFSIWVHCLSPSLCTASSLPTVLTSNDGFPFY